MSEPIDPRSPVPLYEQIAARFRVAIAASELGAGEALPSVRKLSSSLRVNPSTVVQAYRDLERDGWVETRHGSGTFVRELAVEQRDGARRDRARELVRELMSRAAMAGLSGEDLKRALDEEVGR